MCMYAVAAIDNEAETSFAAFLQGVAQFGAPRFVRVDGGGENAIIVRYMRYIRGSNGAIIGRSVHNQRIERWWRDLFAQVGFVFYRVFCELERQRLLDINNEEHMAVFQAFFLPLLNRSLREFQQAWNSHSIRTAANRTPVQLRMLSQREFPASRGIVDMSEHQVAAQWLQTQEAYRDRIFPALNVRNACTVEQLIARYRPIAMLCRQ